MKLLKRALKNNTDKRLDGVGYQEKPSIERCIFLCGLHRSGTTLIERFLASYFHVSYLRADVPESEGQHVQNVYLPAEAYGGPGKFAFSRSIANDIEALTDYERCKRDLLDAWSTYTCGPSEILVEKSPPNLTKIDWLRNVFEGAIFLIIARDPRAVAAATQKWSKTSLPELMMHWNVAYSKAMRDFREEDCYVIRYEDFCLAPYDTILKFAEFANLNPNGSPHEIDSRFLAIKNTNDKYLTMHDCQLYGEGIWAKFNYDV